MSFPDDSSTLKEEEAQHPELLTTDTDPKQEEESEDGASQTDLEEEAEPNGRRYPQNWEAIMEGAKGLAYDDPQLDSDTTVMGTDGPQGPALSLYDKATNCLPHTPRRAATYAGVANGPYATTGGGNHWWRCCRGPCG